MLAPFSFAATVLDMLLLGEIASHLFAVTLQSRTGGEEKIWHLQERSSGFRECLTPHLYAVQQLFHLATLFLLRFN